MTIGTFSKPLQAGIGSTDLATKQGQLQFLDWATQVSGALSDMPSLAGNNRFVGTLNAFHDDGVLLNASSILLNDGYTTLIDVRKSSTAGQKAGAAGGNAGIYVQHRIDAAQAVVDTANIGIRAQLETYQTAKAGVGNDAIAVYGGLYNGGVDVGGFGMHIDAYHYGTGTIPSTYGFNAELFRGSSAGFTVGFHARSISGASYYDNDYAFLASPSGAATKKFKVVLAAGSTETGDLDCDVGIDLGHSTCNTAAAIFPANAVLVWDPLNVNIGRLKYATGGLLSWSVAGVTKFSVDTGGNLVVPGSVTGASAAFGGLAVASSLQLGGRDVVTSVSTGAAPGGVPTGSAVLSWGGGSVTVATY